MRTLCYGRLLVGAHEYQYMSVLEYEYYSSMRDSAPGPNLISICDMLSALLVFVLVIVDRRFRFAIEIVVFREGSTV